MESGPRSVFESSKAASGSGYSWLWRGNLRIDLASNPVKFGDDRSTPIFELSNCQIQLLFTMMIFYCWVYMGVDNDLHLLEKGIEENENVEK
ncbi:jg20528 [Pararge aegeria aegeria]|uniref:Jg20528 protein n=1 Tax=Pararge aegeria aegeria TaxID=348720 RepID=A0A8S4R1L7_9NEOP|nr:jg20528 [Pararge aegeria aegeria]